MRLDELAGALAGGSEPARRPRRRPRDRRARLRQPLGVAGRSVLLRPRLPRRRARLRRRARSRRAPRRWSSSARSGSASPRCSCASARAAMAPLAARFYGEPAHELRVVGVTGTNGKTTTAYLVRALLEATGRQCGLLGTVKSVIGGRERPVERTTPEAIDLQADLRAMLDGGDRACAMEVSSHALELGRTAGDPLRRRDLHEPHPGPPRLPPHDGGLLPGQAPAVRAAPGRSAPA